VKRHPQLPPWIRGRLRRQDRGRLAQGLLWHGRGERDHRGTGWRRFGVNQVRDRSLMRADNAAVRSSDEVADSRRMPVVAAGHATARVQPLLDDGPLALNGDHERVQVNLEAVGDGVVVDSRRQPAGANQRVAVQAAAVGDHEQFVRRGARVAAAAAADVDAQLVRPRRQAALERAHDRSGDSGGMPIHAHDGAEGLEPEGVAEAGQERRTSVMVDDGLADGGPELRHPVGQPLWHAAAMER
jgi:hypothetical protein